MPETMTNRKVLAEALDEKVLAVLRSRDAAFGPTEIGLKLGYDYQQASSAMMAPIRRLIAAGRAKLVKKGHYTATMDEAEEKAKGGPHARR